MRTIRCVVGCSRNDGPVDFHFVIVRLSEEAYKEGDHYSMAIKHACEEGFEGTYLAFDETDPAFKYIREHSTGVDWSTVPTIGAK